MRMSNRELQLWRKMDQFEEWRASQSRPLGDRFVRTDGCMDEETIWQGAQGSLSRDKLGPALDHVMGCSRCTMLWQIALAKRVADEPRPSWVERIWSWFRAWLIGDSSPTRWLDVVVRQPATGWAFAAFFFLASIALFPVGPTQDPLVLAMVQPDVIEPPDVTRRLWISEPQVRSLVDDGQTFSRDRLTLKWDLMRWERSGPARYDVRILTDDLEEIFIARSLEVAELKVPKESLSDLASGTAMLWQVEAYLADGKTAKSPTYLAVLEQE